MCVDDVCCCGGQLRYPSSGIKKVLYCRCFVSFDKKVFYLDKIEMQLVGRLLSSLGNNVEFGIARVKLCQIVVLPAMSNVVKLFADSSQYCSPRSWKGMAQIY